MCARPMVGLLDSSRYLFLGFWSRWNVLDLLSNLSRSEGTLKNEVGSRCRMRCNVLAVLTRRRLGEVRLHRFLHDRVERRLEDAIGPRINQPAEVVAERYLRQVEKKE